LFRRERERELDKGQVGFGDYYKIEKLFYLYNIHSCITLPVITRHQSSASTHQQQAKYWRLNNLKNKNKN
jgi:hypothetical protein